MSTIQTQSVSTLWYFEPWLGWLELLETVGVAYWDPGMSRIVHSLTWASGTWVGWLEQLGESYYHFFSIQSLHLTTLGFRTSWKSQGSKGSHMVLSFPLKKSFKIRETETSCSLKNWDQKWRCITLAYSIGQSSQRPAQIQRSPYIPPFDWGMTHKENFQFKLFCWYSCSFK